MSANKKTNAGRQQKSTPDFGRQSSLLSFFQKTPKQEPKVKETEVITVEEVTDECENSPSINKSSSLLERSVQQDGKRPLGALANCGHDQQDKLISLIDNSGNEDRGVGFLSCASSASPAIKRRRVVISSDEEEERVNVQGSSSHATPLRGRKKSERMAVEVEKMTEGRDKMEVDEKKLEKTVRSVNKENSKKAWRIDESTQSIIHSFSFTDVSTPEKKGSSESMPEKRTKNIEKKTLSEAKHNSPSLGEHFPHLDFEFLKPNKLKDAKGRRPTDQAYDNGTLYVPDEFLKNQSPGHQQWWRLKATHFDTVLFFKVGKFYELYHMDAVVAVENLGLTYMRGKFAHCGFPEVGYGRFADQLVNRGFKVARVEQTETPEQLAERQKKAVVKEKVVRREICRVTTRGTKTYGVLDGTDQREMDGTTEPNPSYLMALTEKSEQPGTSFRYGICFVDCSMGSFMLSEFDDDHSQGNLRTLLAHNYPAQLIYGKGTLSAETMMLLNTMLANVPKETLSSSRSKLKTAEDALTALCADNYFGTDLSTWPETIRITLADPGAAIPQPSSNSKLCLSALGEILWYMQQCLIDVDTISMRQFEQYLPPSIHTGNNAEEGCKGTGATDMGNFWKNKHMVLDGVSLLNLHILPALSLGPVTKRAVVGDASIAFSLFNTINRCQTAFGKRLLRQWVSAPSCDQEVLLGRQRVIGWLLADGIRPHLMKWSELLQKVPDLERLFQRIHTIGLKHRADPVNGHPDSRAQMFEADKYNKRKIRDLLIVLDGLEVILRLMRLFVRANGETEEKKAPSLLVKCLSSNGKAMAEDLEFFKAAFDRENALKQGIIIPHKGVDREYDEACRGVEECKSQLDAYLEGVRRRLKCSTIKFVGTGRNSHQMEVPDSHCRSIAAEFKLTSQRKGFKRYSTDELQQLVGQLDAAESRGDAIGAEVTRRVFADFDARKDKWSAVVKHIATFDCLLGLTLYAQSTMQPMCFPEFVYQSEEPFLIIERGFHPSMIASKGGGRCNTDFNYIPNDCRLGGDQGTCVMLLTGPNMGGKSTYMRQIATLVTLAQIGSMVPATSMRLTPVDRIFSRIGASDRLSAGQSTFYVELSETNTILRQATRHSLVLIDELGRGTSTHDGTAIACAVLKHISRQIKCRMLFSTHYHALCKFVTDSPDIRLAHMACMVENANLEDPTMESITFLYTLADGLCDKSYGFYTGKMAGLDVEVVRRAFEASKMLDRQGNQAERDQY